MDKYFVHSFWTMPLKYNSEGKYLRKIFYNIYNIYEMA